MATESKTKARLGVRLDDEYKTSMEAEIRLRRISYLPDEAKEAEKETCVICLDEDIGSDVMFAVDKCGHRFCRHYVKQHIEVKLLDETFPSCLQHRCKSQLSIIDRCDKLLTLKLSLMWKQRIREDSTPFTERVYCLQGRLTTRATSFLLHVLNLVGLGHASNAVAPSVSTAKFHGIIDYRVAITRSRVLLDMLMMQGSSLWQVVIDGVNMARANRRLNVLSDAAA
ncbi:unnamed protein product [Brassica oleracea]